MKRFLRFLPLLAIAVYFATGFYKVEPEELAVVKRFGRVTERAVPSGLHWRLPAPFEEHETFQTTTVYKMGVGMITRDYLRGIPSPEELSLFLTGDTNILSVKIMLQYTVVDLADYLYTIESPQFLMAKIAEAALTDAVGTMGVEDVLTSGRALISQEVRRRTQERLDELNMGISISSVNLLSVDPPSQVIDVFRDVSNAAADRERIRNEANGYANSVIPRARGEASWIIERGQADRNSRIARAKGEASRFLSVLEEYEREPDATRTRLYLETLETVLPRVDRYVLDPGQEGRFDLKILDLQGKDRP
ncbi:MAG: FtsH protease activity modulator HflK [Gemmatimonadetes bacterium]|nr:FtsH protease activity modulator HflK [Gemmatimonadota bacterium]